MDDTETTTATQEAPAAVTEVSTPAGEPTGEPTGAETTVAQEPSAPPWASIAEPDDVLDLEPFQPLLQSRVAQQIAPIREWFDGELARRTKDWEATEAHSRFSGLAGRLQERLEIGDLEGADKVLNRLQQFMEPYTDSYQNNLD